MRPLLLRLVNSIGMEFAPIPAGTFLMGALDGEGSEDEHPRHEVEITRPYYLGVYPVTQEQYQRVVGSNPSWFSASGRSKEEVQGMDTGRFPVEGVSWEDAVAFCRRLSELPEEKEAGRSYRLPTEAEWEYACRGGAATYSVFHYGDTLSSTQANFDGNFSYGAAPTGPFLRRPTTVGSYQPNGLGLFDTHGNVQEWCSDWYDRGYYQQGPRQNPHGPETGMWRVVRGGSWGLASLRCRSAARGGNPPELRDGSVGFRAVLVLSGLGDGVTHQAARTIFS
jgi:formylglycine-generating enzyme required for sulfatase activity